MTLKKQFDEYIKSRQPGVKHTGWMNLEKFCLKHFGTRRSMFTGRGIGVNRLGIRNYIRITGIIRDLGRMGVIKDVDEAIEVIDDMFAARYEWKK